MIRAAAVALLLAVGARADAPVQSAAVPTAEAAPAVAPDSTSLPAERPALPLTSTHWRIRPYIGISTVSMGGVDNLPRDDVKYLEPSWTNAYGATVTSRKRRPSRVGFIEGLDAAFELDSMVAALVRIGRLETMEGILRTVAEGGGHTITDEWYTSARLSLLGGGAAFLLPLTRRTRLNVTLFLGAGLADIRLDHRLKNTYPDGSVAISEGATEGTGTTFIPEFGFELEHEITESLLAGVSASVRFGGVESFTSRFNTSINVFNVPESGAGAPIRDVNGNTLGANFDGLVLAAFLTARL